MENAPLPPPAAQPEPPAVPTPREHQRSPGPRSVPAAPVPPTRHAPGSPDVVRLPRPLPPPPPLTAERPPTPEDAAAGRGSRPSGSSAAFKEGLARWVFQDQEGMIRV